MCTRGQKGRECVSFLTGPNQNDPKKFTRNSSTINLEYKPRRLMPENDNVCKTIRQEIYDAFF